MNLQTNKYQQILNGLKEKIRQARFKAALTANAQLLAIYWEVGKTIIQQEKEEGWGAKTIDRLSADLRTEFEDMKGFSVRNLRYMREFAKAYPRFSILQQAAAKFEQATKPKMQSEVSQKKSTILVVQKNYDPAILQHAVAKLPWGHHQLILDKVKPEQEKYFYIQKCIENNWSRSILSLQIDSKLFERQGKTISNFENTLPSVNSDLAKETFKSSYVFDFLTLGEEAKEKDIERALIQHLTKFMLELGRGFSFVGNQYNLTVEDDDYFLDLLFYNIHLKCYVVFELKIGDFKPEFAGKLNFYTNTVNKEIKRKDDKPTIGILLCKTPNKTVVKYSLQGINNPIGVSDYQLANALPKQLKGEMPTIEELEKEIEEEYTELLKPIDKKIGQLKKLLKGLKETPVKEKKSAANCLRILSKVVLLLRNRIINDLNEKEIAEKFEEVEIMILTDNQGHKTDKGVKDYLKQHKEIGEFKIDIQLRGFKPLGTKAFDVWKNIYVVTNTYHYTIGFSSHQQSILVEKLYHELPDKKEFESITDKWTEAVVEDITQQIEHIKKR